MTAHEPQQPTFDGMEPRTRKRSHARERITASHLPIARVVLDIQASHLGQPFDYLIEEKWSATAQPGCAVRVRFGGQRVTGIIWERTDTPENPQATLRYIERVISPEIMVPAQMRRDITAIAQIYGGTRANILRLAVPTRVAKVEEETLIRPDVERHMQWELQAQRVYAHVARTYEQARTLREALHSDGFQAFVMDAAPGLDQWRRDIAWMVVEALAQDRSAVVVLPAMREVWGLMQALHAVGLRAFAPSADDPHRYEGDVVVLSSAISQAERYRAYRAIAQGSVRCVIGLRAAMYAPVEGPALFAIMDDNAYQYADGFMPYANARGVCRLRAQLHEGIFVAYAQARSVLSQWETQSKPSVALSVCGPSASIHAYRDVIHTQAPMIRWLNRDELARLTDSSIGARIPHTAVRWLSKALEKGPVLLSIPSDGVTESLSCATCLLQARCNRCYGPLEQQVNKTPRCRWCGAAAVDWHCANCGGDRLRVIRVGAAGTAQELQGLFRNVPMVLSSPQQPQGAIEQVQDAPMIVIATPGAEPRVRAGGASQGHYQAVAILDAWTSLYQQHMDARVDVLRTWMRAMSYGLSRSDKGIGLIIGETDPLIAQALIKWDPRVLTARELAEREEIGLPPALSAACVWGRRDAVTQCLARIGVSEGGDWATMPWHGEELPAVLGPVPIAPAHTINAQELEAMGDRVKAVVRVPHTQRAALAQRLHHALALHQSSRESGELRFRLDPKDLL